MNGAMPRWCYWIAGFFVLDALQVFGFIDRLVYGLGAPGSDMISQTLNVLMIAAGSTLFGVSCRWSKRGFTTGSVLAFSAVGFLCLSSLWSLAPETSIREGIIYLFVIIGVIGIARTMDADEYMHLLSWCCFLSAIASIFVLIGLPTDEIRGIFSSKNVLGQVMATGALATLHDIRVARRRYLGKLCMLFVMLGMAYASKSTTALLAALLFCGISGFDSLWRKGGAARMAGVILAVVLAPVIIVTVAAPDTFLEMIGKDPTLTGRTEIWAYVIQDIWKKPLLGWGYFGFWSVSNPAALEIFDAMGILLPHAHNGLLECLLNIGVIGTALFASILIRNIVLAVRCLRTPERALAISTISCCAGILLVGVSESVLLSPAQSLNPVVFVTGLMCEQVAQAAKRRRHYRIAASGNPIGRPAKAMLVDRRVTRQGYHPSSFVV
jgi:exopolysaccharide production protein ExoQ